MSRRTRASRLIITGNPLIPALLDNLPDVGPVPPPRLIDAASQTQHRPDHLLRMISTMPILARVAAP